MRNSQIGHLVRSTKIIAPEDAVSKAAEVLRVSGLESLPVVSGGIVVGLINEEAILHALTAGDPLRVAEERVAAIMSSRALSVQAYMTVGQVAEIMNDRGLSILPVLNEYGRYAGIVTRSDIASALSLTIRPPIVAGMATPLGVYLTTGHLRAGAGNLGLFLTGVMLMLMTQVAAGVILGGVWLIDKTNLLAPWSLWTVLHSPHWDVPNWMDIVRSIILGASIPIFLLLLRWLPLAGYHAAEHQVVHAIENGEPLKLENVMSMPRVHPRCGTNIIAGVMIYLMVAHVFSHEVAALIAIFVLVFAWRIIGSYFQYYITTKPPTPKQLESGIKAGRELLEQFRLNPGYQPVTGWRRIWNTGMPQVMLGAFSAMMLRELFLRIIPI